MNFSYNAEVEHMQKWSDGSANDLEELKTEWINTGMAGSLRNENAGRNSDSCVAPLQGEFARCMPLT